MMVKAQPNEALNDYKPAAKGCGAAAWKNIVIQRVVLYKLLVSPHCSSFCSCEELYVPPLSFFASICFILGPSRRPLGCPAISPHCLPMQHSCFHPARHTGRGFMCHLVDAGLFRTTGRGSSGRDHGERQIEAGCGVT